MFRIALAILLLIFATNGHAQWQLGIAGGIANYGGDLANKIYVPQLTRPAFGVQARYEVSNRIVLRSGLMLASVAGHDRYIKQDYLRLRNLSFESRIAELSAVAEVHTFRWDIKRWSPYIFGGIALYHFNPYTYNGIGLKVFLQSLSTEGQGLPGYTTTPYKLTQLALPIGGGMRYNITDRIILSGEIGLRKLFTDHLDDVSTAYAGAADLLQYRGQQAVDIAYRGDEISGGDPRFPQKGTQRGGVRIKDFYYLSTLQLSFRLGDGEGAKNKRSGYGCPVGF